MKKFLFVIESMDPLSHLIGAKHSPLLFEAAKISGIGSMAFPVIDRSDLSSALEQIRRRSIAHSGHTPIVHIACHGAVQGIQLMNRDVLNWNELATLLRPLNESVRGNLIVGLSSCFGSEFGKTATWRPGDFPCAALFAPKAKIEIGEAALAWAVLYYNLVRHDLSEGKNRLIDQMNNAIGRTKANGFVYYDERRTKAVLQACMRQSRGKSAKKQR